MCGENSLEHQSAHGNSDAQAALWTWLVLSENHIRFSSAYLDVTESLDEIAVKIGARSAMSKAIKAWEDGGCQTADRPGRRRVLRGGLTMTDHEDDNAAKLREELKSLGVPDTSTETFYTGDVSHPVAIALKVNLLVAAALYRKDWGDGIAKADMAYAACGQRSGPGHYPRPCRR
jgi:hypothetical protein